MLFRSETELVDHNLLSRIATVASETGISAWEKEFLGSIEQYFANKNRLSHSQLSTFKRIESRFTPELKAAQSEFRDSFTDEMRSDMKIVAGTYNSNKSIYYREITKEILQNDSFVPTKQQWEKFMNTKYAKGYLENYKARPKFKIGDTVTASSRGSSGYSFTIAIVIDNEGIYPTSYAAGGKKYVILPYGETNTITIEERDLKFYRQ